MRILGILQRGVNLKKILIWGESKVRVKLHIFEITCPKTRVSSHPLHSSLWAKSKKDHVFEKTKIPPRNTVSFSGLYIVFDSIL